MCGVFNIESNLRCTNCGATKTKLKGYGGK